MKLSKWAKSVGLSYNTAYRLFRSGKLPVKANQLATGTILVEVEEKQTPDQYGNLTLLPYFDPNEKGFPIGPTGKDVVGGSWGLINGIFTITTNKKCGCKEYRVDELLHREDGPAIDAADCKDNHKNVWYAKGCKLIKIKNG